MNSFRRIILSFTTLLLLTSIHASAEEENLDPSRNNDSDTEAYLSFSGNYAFKIKPDALAEEWKNGIGGGFGVEYYLSKKSALRLMADMSVFGYDDEEVEKDLSYLGDVEFDISPVIFLSFALELKYSFLKTDFSPYMAAGLGFIGAFGGNGSIYINGSEYSTPLIENDGFLISPAVGIEYQKADKFGVFLQGAMKLGLVRGDNYMQFPITLGLNIPFGSKLAEFLLGE